MATVATYAFADATSAVIIVVNEDVFASQQT
jgi:hypothetical protein